MSRLIQICTGFIIVTFGVAIVILGAKIFIGQPLWPLITGLFVFAMLGGAFVIAGARMVMGDSIMDILRDFFNGIYWS